MKTPNHSHPTSVIVLLRIFTFAAVFGLSGCALLVEDGRNNDSPIPVRAVEAEGGVISAPRAYEVSGRLIVSGNVIRIFGPGFPPPSHVAVQLVDADGAVFSEKLFPLDAPQGRAQQDRYEFAVSFPLAGTAKADWIVIRYHPKVHGAY
ncbi:MAG: hypothetical protein WA771_00975 [Chthoniobacterales bacterium]